eukprot:gene16108-biopygen9767
MPPMYTHRPPIRHRLPGRACRTPRCPQWTHWAVPLAPSNPPSARRCGGRLALPRMALAAGPGRLQNLRPCSTYSAPQEVTPTPLRNAPAAFDSDSDLPTSTS